MLTRDLSQKVGFHFTIHEVDDADGQMDQGKDEFAKRDQSGIRPESGRKELPDRAEHPAHGAVTPGGPDLHPLRQDQRLGHVGPASTDLEERTMARPVPYRHPFLCLWEALTTLRALRAAWKCKYQELHRKWSILYFFTKARYKRLRCTLKRRRVKAECGRLARRIVWRRWRADLTVPSERASVSGAVYRLSCSGFHARRSAPSEPCGTEKSFQKNAKKQIHMIRYTEIVGRIHRLDESI